MKTSKAIISAILYTSKTLSNGEHPIMVRVCYNGKRKYKSTGLSCSKGFWSTAKQEVKDRHPLAVNMNTIINFEVSKLKDLVLDYERQGKSYSAQTLIDASLKQLPSRKTLYDLFEERIKYFKNTTKKYNTATGYKTLLNIIKRYTNDKPLELFDIDSVWLTDFETYLFANYADTSIKKFWDTFRAIMNYAVLRKLIDRTPFADFTAHKLDTRTKKRALGIDEINLLFSYYVRTYSLNTSKHIWFTHHKEYQAAKEYIARKQSE